MKNLYNTFGRREVVLSLVIAFLAIYEPQSVSMMAPHIVDPQNATDIYKLFSFDSDKEKAGEIMRKCK